MSPTRYRRSSLNCWLAGRGLFYAPPEQRTAPEDAVAGETAPLVGGEVLDVPAPDELLTTKSDARSLRNALRLLERRATQEFMDKGIWLLYLAAGVLRWRDPDGEEEAQSPLVLVPVELRRENPEEPYELRRVEEDVVINPALSLRLADFGIELPTIEQDDFDLDATLDVCRGSGVRSGRLEGRAAAAGQPIFLSQGGHVPRPSPQRGTDR